MKKLFYIIATLIAFVSLLSVFSPSPMHNQLEGFSPGCDNVSLFITGRLDGKGFFLSAYNAGARKTIKFKVKRNNSYSGEWDLSDWKIDYSYCGE